MAKLTPEEREAILADLQGGMSRNAASRKHGRGAATVTRIAQAAGLEMDRSATKKATEVRKAVAEINRMEIIGDILTTGQTLLKSAKEARDYKDVVTGLAIGIDKHRLETGEVTDRKETRQGNDLKDFFSELDQETEREWASDGDSTA